MAITEWKEPIYERQDGETPRQYYFLNEFFNFDGNLEEFIMWIESGCDVDSDEPIELEYKPFAAQSFRGICTRNKWMSRRDAKRIADIDRRAKQLEAIEDERFIERYKLKEDNEYLALKRVNSNLRHNERYTGGQFRDHTQGIRNLQDSRSIDRGEPTEISKNQHNIDGNIDSTVVTGTISQEMILKPEYAEATRKVLENLVQKDEENEQG
ncbi:MAG: hypothetical protein IJH65_10165 [Methanobrevibacter sp.]|nr:hypothetical protein [Methanobrevibacter sp.]